MRELIYNVANYIFALFACVALTICDWVEAVREVFRNFSLRPGHSNETLQKHDKEENS